MYGLPAMVISFRSLRKLSEEFTVLQKRRPLFERMSRELFILTKPISQRKMRHPLPSEGPWS
jgi:type II secretory pathway component PulJ